MPLASEADLSLVEDMLSEMDVYLNYKKRLSEEIRHLELDYQAEKFGYIVFKEKLDHILKGKTEEEWNEYYGTYVFSLVKRIDKILAELFYQVYSDKRVLLVEADKPVPKEASMPEEQLAAPPVFVQDKVSPRLNFPRFADVKREIDEAEKSRLLKAVEAKRVAKPVAEQKVVPKANRFGLSKLFSAFIKSIKTAISKLPKLELPKVHKPVPKPLKVIAPKPAPIKTEEKRQSVFSRFPSISALFRKSPKPAAKTEDTLVFKGKKSPFINELTEMEKGKKQVEKVITKSSGGVVFGWFSARHLWDEILGRFKTQQEPIVADETEVPQQMEKLREARKRLYESEKQSTFDTTLLAQEARRVKRILDVEKPSVYKGNSLGLIANVTVKKVSLFMVDQFPDLFGRLYNALRAANIKVLSNTYVNIMILISAAVFLFSGTALTFFFFAMNYELYQIALRAGLISIGASIACLIIFYAYPFIKIKDRRKSITTNLPFAINHISSVAASGVPPTKMFELIAASGEYGEVAVEIRKIVDFITVFGYDSLTAVKAVAASTPSPAFKEFLEGLVSTVETGGDLDNFLKQKSDEATLTYQLERQRYNEAVGTYSDIYTGLLIAAPLFFIASLTMVNLLGGTVGGMGVDTLMTICSYVAIPVLNLGFIAFLQINQPEV
jgi:archaeal flagellar protein FlaJ